MTDRQTSPHLLKIFTGPHAGAEVILSDGEVLIGSDESCDVILNDRFIEPQHVRVSLTSGDVRLLPAEGATVLVKGKPIPAAGVTLSPFEYFTLGTTHLAVGPSESPWPQTNFPDFQLAAASPEPVSEPPSPAAAPAEPSGLPVKRAASRRRAWPALAAGACLLLALSWVASQYFGDAAAGTSAAGESTGSISEKLAELLRGESVSEFVKHSERGGRHRVEGHLATANHRRTLERKLKQVVPTIELRLWDNEALVAGVQRMIALHKLNLEAGTGDPGEVIVHGQVKEAKAWETARKSIRDDIRSLRKLTDQVEIEVPPKAPIVVERKTAVPLPEKGEYPAALVTKWEELRSQVAGVHIGHASSLILANGDRLFPGTALAAGFVVQGIESDAVICSNGNQQIRLSLRSHE